MKPVWTARTGSGVSPMMQAIGDSTAEDREFLPFDIQGTIAHVHGLLHAGLINDEEAKALVQCLQSVPADLELDAELEDVHMNLEAHLGQQLGCIGKKVHTGRSRNDQVATCITLYTRDRLHTLGQALLGLLHALQEQMDAHGETAWISRTHGQNAQSATIAFLLHAHATRFLALLQDTLHTLDQVSVSPLGSGAVAGSTLPLDPAHTARLLGLQPPTNALAATGTGDCVRRATDLATFGGSMVADLASDLMQAPCRLHPGHTTGSSLMPHKRNPDSLELLRGKANALAGAQAAVHVISTGTGLGYRRDLQATKPHLFALDELVILVMFLTEVVQNAEFYGDELDDPGLLATDLAETLVQDGMPFRDAYQMVAQVYAQVELGTPFHEAVKELPLPVAPLKADPAARRTLGAPGNTPPLDASVNACAAALAKHSTAIAAAEDLVEAGP